MSDWMYENVPVGEFFYIVSVPGAVRKPIAIYRISEYEWVGNPDEVKDYTHLYAAQGQAEERVENTILARRPLTKGRKWRLTDEEIARDLLENRVITGERVAGVFVAVAAMGGLLFLANTTAAVITLAGGGAAAVALLAYYLWYGRQIKGRHFVVVTDTLMDKDPIKRGFGKSKRTRYVLGFRKHRPYTLPVADESVYHDAELGDTFFVVRMEGKSKKIRVVYNALDVEVENDDE